MVPLNNLGPDAGKLVNKTSYKGMIGSLMYLTATRPYIEFSIVLCARYRSNPKESHLSDMKRILRYVIKSTARILNMVPTNKFKRTPYEIWHGKAPKLSYLKLATGRLVSGSSCDGIDMVVKDLELEPKVDAMMRKFLDPSWWKELSKETSSKILLCGDGSCWNTFKPLASLIEKRKLK
nr:uncharacterized mitochondrial protein AtMg00810-like [Tanacetum cinerariifolium]